MCDCAIVEFVLPLTANQNPSNEYDSNRIQRVHVLRINIVIHMLPMFFICS